MFSAAGGFRFISGGGLNYGIYLTQGLNDVSQGYQRFGGSTYFVGSPGTTNNDIVMNKFDISYQQTYGTKLSGSSTRDVPTNLVLDASNNQIVIGTTNANTVGNNDMYISKFDSTGNVAWQKTVGTSVNDTLVDLVLTDNDANIIAVGNSNASTNAWVGKFSSSNGNLLTQYTMTNYTTINSIASDNNNNIYMVITQNSTPDGVLVLKTDSNFTKAWGQYITYGSNDITGTGIAVDNNGNVYATVSRISSNEDFLFKFNSSGTLQWQKTFNYGTQRGWYAMTTDSNNNLYMAADFGTIITVQALKIDTNGNLTWSRGLNGYNPTPSNPLTAEDCGVNNISYYNNRLMINGYSFYNTVRKGMLLSVPDDGSKVATYTDGYVWGYGPFTLSNSSLTVTSSLGPAFTSASLTVNTGTLSSSTYGVAYNPIIPF